MAQGPEVHAEGSDGEFVQFWAAGASVKGEFHCSECGYGVAVYRALPTCPMCGGESWEQAAWRPFWRATALPPPA